MSQWGYRYRVRRALGLWLPLVLIAALSAAASSFAWRFVERHENSEQRLARAMQNGESDIAERLAWQIARATPLDIEAWVRFVDIHAENGQPDDDDSGPAPAAAIAEKDVRDHLDRIPDPRAQAIARYWYLRMIAPQEPDSSAVVRMAKAQPPARYANYVLARAAMNAKDWRAAAQYYEREGLAFPDGGRRSLRSALSIWVLHRAWDEIRSRSQDRRWSDAIDTRVRAALAAHDRDWPRILLWSWPASFAGASLGPVLLALLSGALWFILAVRLGRMQDRVPGRAGLYAAAFALGALSPYLTILITIVEERFFGLRELGQFVPDLIYFTFGVGLREEASKALLFLPLLPALLRRGSRIEAMTCGALVGLGFAAEENILYFHDGAAAALPRFLTANFLHMTLTALVALSAFDTMRKRATRRDAFNVTFPFVVAIHGAYDFLLTTNDMPLSSLLALALYIFVARQFLRQLLIASSREEEEGVLYLLIGSLALITGASYVYATTVAGPWIALRLIAVGGIGAAIVIYMFVRELSPR